MDREGASAPRRTLRRRPPREAELAFLQAARVGHLATVGSSGEPSVVPVCFAVMPGPVPMVVAVLDEKPKRVADTQLARVRNILHHPTVALVVDRYDEDWSLLAFVQVRGRARMVEPGDEGHAAAIEQLRAKYPQYRSMAIEQRPLVLIEGLTGTSWRGDGTAFANDGGVCP